MAVYSPVIFGIDGLNMSADEAAFFHDVRPWGIILFARNIESRDQLRGLTDSLREMSGRADLPILIDQEGGRVARLKQPTLCPLQHLAWLRAVCADIGLPSRYLLKPNTRFEPSPNSV